MREATRRWRRPERRATPAARWAVLRSQRCDETLRAEAPMPVRHERKTLTSRDGLASKPREWGLTRPSYSNRPAATDDRQVEGPYRRVRLNAWLGRMAHDILERALRIKQYATTARHNRPCAWIARRRGRPTWISK